MSGNLYVFNIYKHEINGKKFNRIRKFIKTLERMGKEGYQSVVFLFDGYNNISDELYEIQEVREWIKALLNRIPHIFYFINPIAENHLLLLAAIGDVKTSYKGELKLSPIEYEKRGTKPLEIPKILIEINISDKDYLHIISSLQTYGRKINDIKGSVQVINIIDILLNKEPEEVILR